MFKKIKKITKVTLFSSVIAAGLALAILQLPRLHSSIIRSYVGGKIVKVTNKAGDRGGTGYIIEAPSGAAFVLTNAHVCIGAQEPLYGHRQGARNKLKVVEISKETDLCLLDSPYKGVNGLELADSADIGEELALIGHPALMPITMVKGELITYTEAAFPIPSEFCESKKGPFRYITVYDFFKICIGEVPEAAMTTLVALGGNSGSPIINIRGQVVGTLFAARSDNHWSLIVSLESIRSFLKGR
jgi:S1-C subfamily serine protease